MSNANGATPDEAVDGVAEDDVEAQVLEGEIRFIKEKLEEASAIRAAKAESSAAHVGAPDAAAGSGGAEELSLRSMNFLMKVKGRSQN